MLVSRFFQWVMTADARQRTDACAVFADAACQDGLSATERQAFEVILAHLANDPSPPVRLALAQALAESARAPRAIVVALAHDRPAVAAPVLARSPVLTEADLLDVVQSGAAAVAILERPGVSAALAAALVAHGASDVWVALARHPGARFDGPTLRALVAHARDCAALREALVARADLPASLRADLVRATAQTLVAFTQRCGWLTAPRAARVTRDAQDKAALLIAAAVPDQSGQTALAAHLRREGQVTMALILRALLSGHAETAAALVADLAAVPAGRVVALAAAPGSAGFGALYRKAGLPEDLRPVVKAAWQAGATRQADGSLDSNAVRRVLAVCGHESEPARAILRRFEAEALQCDAAVQALPWRRRAARRPVRIDLAALEAQLLAA